MSDDLNSKNTIEMKLLETSLRQPSIALPILSNHYFKHREFQKSFNALIELSKSEPFNAKKWLSFGNNLRRENEYFLSIKAYQFTLKNNLKGYQYGEGLLGLAKTFEDQILPTESNDLIPYFYNDNILGSNFPSYKNVSDIYFPWLICNAKIVFLLFFIFTFYTQIKIYR